MYAQLAKGNTQSIVVPGYNILIPCRSKIVFGAVLTHHKGDKTFKGVVGDKDFRKYALANSPIVLNNLLLALETYPDREAAGLLADGFQFGFSLNYSGPRQRYEAKNLKSVDSNMEIVRQKISKELEAGRIGGPYDEPPFTNFRVSPLGLVPKKEEGEFRLIHHLSYPSGDSVNDHIDPKLCSVQYTSFDKAIEMVQKLGPGALLAKADIKSAFRLLPVSPSDFELLGFKFEGKYYFDKCLPFGCSISCALFEKFATFLEYLVRQLVTAGHLEHYLDDYLGGGTANNNECKAIIEAFHSQCNILGVPLAKDKCLGPVTQLVFLGLELDSVMMQVRVPMDKVNDICAMIKEVLRHARMQLRTLQSLIGSLNFMCRAISPGRPFCRRLINATCGLNQPHHFLRINKGMREDLQMWLKFFQSFNGISVFHDRFWRSNADFTLYTDSAGSQGLGFGIFFQGKWACAAWPDSWFVKNIASDITVLELFPILVAITLWGAILVNRKVLFHCDNQAVVAIINTQTSKSNNVMILLRSLILKCLQFNIVLKAEHIPGSENALTDALSRFQIGKFRRLAPNADTEPTHIPQCLFNVFNKQPSNY